MGQAQNRLALHLFWDILTDVTCPYIAIIIKTEENMPVDMVKYFNGCHMPVYSDNY